MGWRNGVLIGMALFMAMIVFFITKMVSSKVDIIKSDYYETGVNYQNTIRFQKNGQPFADSITVTRNSLVWRRNKPIKVLLIYLADKNSDFKIELTKSDTLVFEQPLLKGIWLMEAIGTMPDTFLLTKKIYVD